MEYYIKGNTYSHKEDLKAWACVWVPNKKCWKSPHMEKGEAAYLAIKRICEICDADLVPIKLAPELQKIQDILSH